VSVGGSSPDGSMHFDERVIEQGVVEIGGTATKDHSMKHQYLKHKDRATTLPPLTPTLALTTSASASSFHQRIQEIFDADNADRISLLIDDSGEAAEGSTEPAQYDRCLIVRSHGQNTANVISDGGD
jgi:hypothetical protein